MMRWSPAATSGLHCLALYVNLPIRFLFSTPQFAFDKVEQLLDRVQPGGVLRVKKDIHFELSGCFVDARMFVYGGVVHQDHDLLGLRFLVNAEFVQRPMQEVVEHDGVSSALCNLS